MTIKHNGYNFKSFYINGDWKKVTNAADKMNIINPATAKVIGSVALGDGLVGPVWEKAMTINEAVKFEF